MAEDLQSILSSGLYLFIIPDSVDSPVQMQLQYRPSTSSLHLQQAVGQSQEIGSTERADQHVHETWDGKQIANFARKLGFLDSEKEGGRMVKPFLLINDVSFQILLYHTA